VRIHPVLRHDQHAREAAHLCVYIEIEIELRDYHRSKTMSSLMAPHNNFLCPITTVLMDDPVICVDGNTYDRPAIQKWFKEKNTSPLTGASLSSKNLTPNISLRQMISEYKELLPDPEPPRPQITTINYEIGTYIGEYIMSGGERIRCGSGVYTWADGSKYDGQWKGDKKHGLGVWTFADGDTYDGQWEGGMMHGLGAWTWADGDKYDGQWKDGNMHGLGVHTSADGDKYDGEWKCDKRHGLGVHTWVNGNKYVGEYKGNKKHGNGMHMWPGGDKYDGEWKGGLRHGLGVETRASGGKYDGEWEGGVKQRVHAFI
jgi:hypothetical protein